MIYKVVSVLCNPATDGYNIAYSELQFLQGKWQCSNFIKQEKKYDNEWQQELPRIKELSLNDALLLNKKFGTYISASVNAFITQNKLEFRVQLIAFSGFPVFNPSENYFELGDAAMIAATTGINTIADFPALDMAAGGDGIFKKTTAAELMTGEAAEIQLALMAVLRWREENNYTASRTGALKNSIGGAVWCGQEA